MSSFSQLKSGVIQGGVLSLALFNIDVWSVVDALKKSDTVWDWNPRLLS